MICESVNVEKIVVECPICMDQIEGEKNKVTTECGHCFHTSCLMKNVAHNGFGCPYCRASMAEEPDDNNSDKEYEEFSIDEEEVNDYSDNVLRGSRWLFQRAEGEELDDEEDSIVEEEEEEPNNNPSVDYIVNILIENKLIEQGVCMDNLVINDHEEYKRLILVVVVLILVLLPLL